MNIYDETPQHFNYEEMNLIRLILHFTTKLNRSQIRYILNLIFMLILEAQIMH